jgi:hypothetical protein
VTASAAIALGQRPGSARPSLTIWGYFDPPGPGLAAAGIVDIVPPPFAKSFTVFRNPANAFTVQQLAGSVYDGPIIVAAGAPSPRFDLLNNVALVRITNTGPAAVLVVGAVFEIGL